MASPEGRVPPYDVTAERAVLGAVLLDNAAWKIVRTLQVDDFYSIPHQRVYQAMEELFARGSAVDAVTLGALMAQAGTLESLGGAMAIAGMTDQAALGAAVRHHVRVVGDVAAARRMLYAAQEVVARGFAFDGDIAAYLGGSRSAVVRAADHLDLSKRGPTPLDEDYRDIYKNLEEGRTPPGLVRTGLENVDRVAGGLWPELTILAARPGMGKSCLALNIATNVARQGLRVCYLTLEDVRETVAIRNMARFSGVAAIDIRLNRVPRDRYGDLLEGIRRASGLPLLVEDTPSLSAAQIAQVVAAERERHGLDLLVVDLLTEMKREGETQTIAIENAARGLRDIAKESTLPVLLLHQLNRKVEENPGKRPGLNNLRQSSDLDGIARAVWFLHRTSYYMMQDDAKGQAAGAEWRRDGELLIAKTNHGQTGTLRMYMDLRTMYVRAWDRHQDGPWPTDVEYYEVPPHFRGDPRMDVGQPIDEGY